MKTLFIAHQNDLHVDSIVYYFKKDFLRLSPEELFEQNLSFSNFQNNSLSNNTIDHSNIKNVFCRFAAEEFYSTDCELTSSENYSKQEFGTSIMSILLMINKNRWFNFPYFEIQADIKPYSLNVAIKHKIKVPKFLITNNIDEIKNFAKTEDLIIKGISDGSLFIQKNIIKPLPETNEFKSGYTNHFDLNRANLEKWDKTPVLLQKNVNKVEEIRVLCINNKIFAVSTEAKTEFIDIRKSKSIYNKFHLEDNFKLKIISLMHALDLRICTFDILLDIDNYLWLTDINPQGNWIGWNKEIDLEISREIALSLEEDY